MLNLYLVARHQLAVLRRNDKERVDADATAHNLAVRLVRELNNVALPDVNGVAHVNPVEAGIAVVLQLVVGKVVPSVRANILRYYVQRVKAGLLDVTHDAP